MLWNDVGACGISNAMTAVSLDAFAAQIPDGALLAIPPGHSPTSNALIRALIGARTRPPRLVGVPASDL